MKNNVFFLPLLIVTTLLGACGGGGGGTSSGSPTDNTGVTVSKIELNPASLILNEGSSQKFTLNATTSDGYGPVPGTGVAWSIGDSDVASVDASGNVSAVATGTTMLTANYGGLSALAEITVTKVVASTYLDATTITIYGLSNKKQVRLYEQYADGSSADVTGEATWSSDNMAIATVLAGNIGAVAAGSTAITATYRGINYPVAVTVSTQDQLTLAVNGTPAQE